MRLTTLARKINKTPKQLIAFLEEKGIEIPNGLYGKLGGDITALVLDHFCPEMVITEIAKPINQIQEVSIENVSEGEVEDGIVDAPAKKAEEITEDKIEKEIEDKVAIPPAESEDQKSGTIEDLESEKFDEIKLIKAKKVTLEGIKVVGKIDLPEKQKKEAVKEANEDELEVLKKASPKENSKTQNRNFNRDRKKNRKGKSHQPLSYEEKLKEEEREKLKKRRRRENAEKRRKKKYYQENIEPKITLKSKKKKNRSTNTNQATSKEKVVAHKNPLKRFWAWLNGQYDKY